MKKPVLNVVLITLILVIAPVASIAQSVTYNVLDNDVQDIKRIAIQANPFYAETYGGVNFATLGAGVSANASILKRIELKGELRMAYLDQNSNLQEKSEVTGLLHPTCKGGTKRTVYTEAGGALYIFDWTRTKDLKVVLHSSSSGGYRYSESINVPGDRRRMFGVRGGFIMYNTETEIGENDSSFPTYTITNGTETMIGVGNPAADNVDGSDITYVNTMVNSSIFYAGISLKSITNLVISASGYGTKKHSGVYDVYVDYLLCPYVKLKDVYTHGGERWDVKHTNEGFKAAGWRVGVSYKSLNKVGFYYKFEIGERPGLYFGEKDKLINGNVNCSLTMGCNIPFSKKK